MPDGLYSVTLTITSHSYGRECLPMDRMSSRRLAIERPLMSENVRFTSLQSARLSVYRILQAIFKTNSGSLRTFSEFHLIPRP